MIEASFEQHLATLLAQALPYLMGPANAAGNKAAEIARSKLGEDAWNKAMRIWDKLRPEVEKEPEVAKAMQDVASRPNDPRAEALISWQLEKLTLPPVTVAELQKLLVESKSDIRITTADRGGVAVGGSVSGGTITAGYRAAYKKHGE